MVRGDFLVFNFEVGGTHTYYAEGVLVHNCNGFVRGAAKSAVGNEVGAAAQGVADSRMWPLRGVLRQERIFLIPFKEASERSVGARGRLKYEPASYHGCVVERDNKNFLKVTIKFSG